MQTKEDGKNYTYDNNGNILTAGNDTFTYNSTLKDRLDKVNNNYIYYSSSDKFTPTSYKNQEYEFERRRLVSVTEPASQADYRTIEYKYDEQGLIIKRIITYWFDGDNDPWSSVTKYYYDGDKLITEVTPYHRNDYLYDGNGQIYGFIQDNTTKYFYVKDFMQNILGIVDTNGKLVVKYEYDANGNVQENTTIYNPIRYKGYYYDDEVDMYYCKTRFYVPEWRRWMIYDSSQYLDINSVGCVNLFAYCNNNPVMYSDGSGHFAISTLVIGAIIGACIGFGTAAYVDSKDGQMFNGDVKWYDYLGATSLGGLAGAGLGAFATTTFTASIPTLGLVNSGGALTLGATGSIELAGAQILTGVGAAGLVIMMAKSVGKYGGYEVKHNYPNDHQPPHVHIYGDDIHRGSHGIRVGLDGNPLKGEPELSPGARRAIRKLMDAIAKVLMPWKG